MQFIKAVLLFVALFAGLVNPVFAAGPFRCNGRIQFSPCPKAALTESPLAMPTLLYTRSVTTKKKSSFHYAEVVSSSFSRLSKDRGEWSGRVRGMGTVNLKLLVYRRGEFESSRYMGSVTLPKDKSTIFKFRSALPKGVAWTTRIFAWAEPLPGITP